MARTRTSVVLAALAAAGLALTACGSDDAGSTTSAGSPTSAATSAPTSPSSPVSASGSVTSSESTTSGATDASSSGTAASGTAASGTAASSAGVGAACTPDKLQTAKSGTLTIATSEPAYEPWMVDDDPSNGKGFESAVAYAVADRLGFAKDAVTWTRVNFDEALNNQSGWDFDINQFTITDERKQAVDFSSGYYDLTQTVVTVKGSPIEKATTVAELKGAKLGAMVGTTSLNAINTVIQPDTKPSVFKSNDLAVQALQNGQIDGLVVDLPTAFYVVGAQVENGVIVGQLPGTGQPEGTTGPAVGQGLAADRLRHPGRGQPAGRRHPGQAGHHLAGRQGPGAAAEVAAPDDAASMRAEH